MRSSGTPRAEAATPLLATTVSVGAAVVLLQSPLAYLMPLVRWCIEAFGL